MEAAVHYFHVCPVTSFLLSCNGSATPGALLRPPLAQRRGERHRLEFDGEGLPEAVSVPVDWCPWTARHLHLSKHGGGVLR